MEENNHPKYVSNSEVRKGMNEALYSSATEELTRKIAVLEKAFRVLLEEVEKTHAPFTKKISKTVLEVLQDLGVEE